MTTIRLLVITLAAGVALLAGATTASANSWQWQLGEGSDVLTDVNFYMTDDEWPKKPTHENYVFTSYLGRVGFVTKSFHRIVARCAGQEVRAELEINGQTSTSKAIKLWLRLNLYEGTDCYSDDLDGESGWRLLTIYPGQSVQTYFNVKNEDEGGDVVKANVQIRARPED